MRGGKKEGKEGGKEERETGEREKKEVREEEKRGKGATLTHTNTHKYHKTYKLVYCVRGAVVDGSSRSKQDTCTNCYQQQVLTITCRE